MLVCMSVTLRAHVFKSGTSMVANVKEVARTHLCLGYSAYNAILKDSIIS